MALGASPRAPGAKATNGCSSLPEGGPEPLLKALIDGGAGIETLAIERPGLHDAFVAIAGNAAAAAMGAGEAAMMRFLRSAFVIARRDFAATVLSKTFIFFLLGPLFPLLLGGLFGGIGARVATQTERPVDRGRLEPQPISTGCPRRGPSWPTAVAEGSVVRLVHYAPEPDAAAQQQRLLATRDPPVRAVLTGGLDHPHLTGAVAGDRTTLGQLKLIIADARAARRRARGSSRHQRRLVLGLAGRRPRAITAQIGQMLLFFLTILLSGMLLSQLIEEKSNKIIEVIAAAVPIDAMFVGKLFAMLAASVVGIVVWISAGALLIQMVKHGGVATLPPPAVGWPGVPRARDRLFRDELSAARRGLPDHRRAGLDRARGADLVDARHLRPGAHLRLRLDRDRRARIQPKRSPPRSSPCPRRWRCSPAPREQPELWPHLAAIAWQALWVALILRIGAQLFRKTVLKSGPRTPWWKLGRA